MEQYQRITRPKMPQDIEFVRTNLWTQQQGKKEKSSGHQSQRKSSNESFPGDHQYDPGEFGAGTRPKTLLLKSVSQQDIEKGDLGGGPNNLGVQTPTETCSRLSKTLQEILHDKDALPYFIQFMESREAGPYVRFWLDAESFQASSWTRVRSRSQISLSKSSLQSSSAKCDIPENSKEYVGNSTYENRFTDDSVLRDQTLEDNNELSDKCSEQQNDTSLQCSNVISANEANCDITETIREDFKPSSCKEKTCDGRISCNNVTSSQLSHNNASLSGPSINNNNQVYYSNNSAHGGSSSANIVAPPTIAGPCEASSTSAGDMNSIQQNEQQQVCIIARVSEQISDNSGDDSSVQHIKRVNSLENVHPSSVHTCSNSNNSASSSEHLSCSAEMEHTIHSASGSSTSCGHLNTSVLNSSVSDSKHSDNISDEQKKAPNQDIQDKLLKSIAKDAVSIFSKYIAKDATHPIGVTEELRAETIHKICREDGHVDPQCFAQCQNFVVKIMEDRHHSDFLFSDFHYKHQIDLLTGTKVYLADILYNDNAFSYLMEYMEQESAMPLLQCWLELDNFQQLLVDRQGQYDGMEAQNDAMVIYDKYFSLQATQPLGFSDSIRFEVEANICREEGPLPDCFVKAKKIVLSALDKDYFPAFTQSSIYYKYLQDLINSVQSSEVPAMYKKRKPTENDSGSEHSFGSQSTHSEVGSSVNSRNTLLATGIHKALHKMEDNMQIDSSLFNPDILWKRPQSGSMSLGKIDELGNYVSEIDNEPEGMDKKQIGFFKKKKEKQKSREEMAAQIAQMIIKDCTVGSETKSIEVPPEFEI